MSATKMLGLVLAATCVLMALPGLATASEFEAEDYPAEVDAQQLGNHVFTAEGGISVQCTAVNLEGEIDQWSETEELSATYGGCTASGFAATVAMNGCTYVFHAGEELEEAGDFEGTFDIKCPAEKAIAISAATCEIQIGPQAGLTEIEYDNNPEATPDNITGTAAIAGIAYTKVKDGIFCPLAGTGVKEDGTYSGSMLVTAEAGGAKKGVMVRKAPVSKLCKKEPKPACAEAYPANTPIEAKAENGKPATTFALEEGGAVKFTISCDTTKASGETEAETGVPIKGVALELTQCKATGSGKACTAQMENKPAKGTIRSDPFREFSGIFEINVMTLLWECKGEIRCEYARAPFWTFVYGMPDQKLRFEILMHHVKTVPEEGCHSLALLKGEPPLLKPSPVWVAEK